MLFLKNLLMWGGVAMILAAIAILVHDLYFLNRHRQLSSRGGTESLPPSPAVRWRISLALAMLAWAPLLVALSIVVVPSGLPGVRISQDRGGRAPLR
jgi:hypothetical protein